MIYPEGDAIRKRVNNRYSLVVLAAKRAKQLKEGAPALIDTASTNPLTIALEEIAVGKVTYTDPVEPEVDDESAASVEVIAPAVPAGPEGFLTIPAAAAAQDAPVSTISAELAAFLPIGQDAALDEDDVEPAEKDLDEADDLEAPEKAQS
ncbi:MAG: DNA-directed RNA polymerase subunit omega [Capsulimonadaceae bacterium]|nr:DNA-directed RNA polymerase subunit omega [Capsulimonadaceae bacterium]